MLKKYGLDPDPNLELVIGCFLMMTPSSCFMPAGQPEAEGEDEAARGCPPPGLLRGPGPTQDPARCRPSG